LKRPTGKFYEGYWENGRMNGNGKQGIGAKVKEGFWVNGKMIKDYSGWKEKNEWK